MSVMAGGGAAFVIKAEEVVALNYLASDHPRPSRVEWINRATDQVMRPSSIEQLLRTLFITDVSPSVRKLRETSGLRVILRSESDRARFASSFAKALVAERESHSSRMTAIFPSQADAEAAMASLQGEGVPADAISMLWRASRFIDTAIAWPEGHSIGSVAGATAGGGIAGAAFGLTVLAIPGVGPVAAIGALAPILTSVATIGGLMGAAGGAIARMLDDFDVDDRFIKSYEQDIKRGKVFLAVDMQKAGRPEATVRAALLRNRGAHTVGSASGEAAA